VGPHSFRSNPRLLVLPASRPLPTGRATGGHPPLPCHGILNEDARVVPVESVRQPGAHAVAHPSCAGPLRLGSSRLHDHAQEVRDSVSTRSLRSILATREGGAGFPTALALDPGTRFAPCVAWVCPPTRILFRMANRTLRGHPRAGAAIGGPNPALTRPTPGSRPPSPCLPPAAFIGGPPPPPPPSPPRH